MAGTAPLNQHRAIAGRSKGEGDHEGLNPGGAMFFSFFTRQVGLNMNKCSDHKSVGKVLVLKPAKEFFDRTRLVSTGSERPSGSAAA